LIRAAGSMSNAESSFGNQDASSAGTSQGEALASLKYTREQLADEAENLLNRLRAEIKKRTIEGLVQMLEGQVVVRQSTERLGPRVKEGARTVLTSVVALAGSEGKLIVIGEGLTALVEETEFGIALPAALRSVTDAMADVKERLAAADASEEVVIAEKQIEEDLAALLEAMKQLPSQGDPGKGQRGGASERERQLNRLIAELKMVRMLQVRVGRDTRDVDKNRPAELKDLSASLVRRIETLQDRQEDVHDVTERIAVERADELPP
jgi:archaellum component FlaC